MINDLLSLAASLNFKTITVGEASNLTPGIPPASSQAFLQQLSSIPTVVLADHFAEYSNNYYHSTYDQSPTSLTVISTVFKYYL